MRVCASIRQSKEVSITDGGDEVEDADYYDVMGPYKK